MGTMGIDATQWGQTRTRENEDVLDGEGFATPSRPPCVSGSTAF
jgi:hypothetical protein